MNYKGGKDKRTKKQILSCVFNTQLEKYGVWGRQGIMDHALGAKRGFYANLQKKGEKNLCKAVW